MGTLRQTRFTKIIFTIGPATLDLGVLRRMVRQGAGICRINMAHASHDWTRQAIQCVRQASEEEGRMVALMMDIKGPEVRTGFLESPIALEKDTLMDLVTTLDAIPATDIPMVKINYPDLIREVNAGTMLLVDSGLMRFQVEAMLEDRLRCRVVIPGLLGSRRHINVPGVKINLPALTEKDLADIELGVAEGTDFFALSFVREAGDIAVLREVLRARRSQARVVAKVEDQSGIENLPEILGTADGLMVARGDLGIEVPFEQLPIIQKQAVKMALEVGKPVIMATHLLESMTTSPMPTRAEITDVSNAVFESVDCVMLSGETSLGKYPEECVKALNKIIQSVQRHAGDDCNWALPLNTPKEKMLKSAVVLARELGGAGIMVFSSNGYLVQVLSALRPHGCPIFMFTELESVHRQSCILWGVESFLMKFGGSSEETVRMALNRLVDEEWVTGGCEMIVIPNILSQGSPFDTMQLRRV